MSGSTQHLVSESGSVDGKVVPDTPAAVKDTFDPQLEDGHLMVAPTTESLPPTSSTAPISDPLITSTTGVVEGRVEAEGVVEDKTDLSRVKDIAKEEAEGSAKSDLPPPCDPAQASDPAVQPSTGTLPVTSGASPTPTGSKRDSGQTKEDKPVSTSSLLEGMVFYITDYTLSMDATVIQKWKEVYLYYYCVYIQHTLCTVQCHMYIQCTYVTPCIYI